MKPRPWSLSSSSDLTRWVAAGAELEKARAEMGRGLNRNEARRGMERRLGIVITLWWD